MIKYVQPASPTNPDAQPELVQTTVRDYDLSEVSKGIKGMLPGLAIMGFMVSHPHQKVRYRLINSTFTSSTPSPS